MPWLLEYRHHRSARAGGVEFDGRDCALADAMIQILEEHEGPALPCHRKRIGVEAVSRIGDDRPRSARQIAGCPDAAIVGVTPADLPMRSVAAKPVDSPGDFAGEAAEHIGGR